MTGLVVYSVQDNPAVHTGRTGAVSILYVTSEHNDGLGWMLTFKLLKNFMISGWKYIHCTVLLINNNM